MSSLPVLTIPFTFTDCVDPTHFHCIRYFGPPFKRYSKSNKYFIFEFPNRARIIAPLVCTWSRDSNGKLVLPIWMRSYYSTSDYEYDAENNDKNDEELNVFECPNPIECAPLIRIRWFETSLKPNLRDTRTFPFDRILPELFGTEGERRPLKKDSVLPFIYQSRRYLLQIEVEDSAEEAIFYFNFEDGEVDLESIMKITEDSEEVDVYEKYLNVLIESSWKREVDILKFEVRKMMTDREGSTEREKQLLLLTGIPHLLQRALFNHLKIESDPVDMTAFVSEEHFEFEDSDHDSDHQNHQNICHIFGGETLSESFFNKIMSVKKNKNHNLICFSAAPSVESSKNLIYLEKLVKRYDFQVMAHSFSPLGEQDRLSILKLALKQQQHDQNRTDSDFEGLKWMLASLDFTDIIRLSKLQSKSNGRSLKQAVAILKEEQNSSSASASELKDFATILSFPGGNESCIPFYGFKEIKHKICSLLTGPLLNSEAYKRFSLPTSSGILIHGPTGSGKTALSLHLLSSPVISTIFTIIHVPSASQLLSKYFGETEANIRALFAKARAMKPTILFIDQIECLGRKRGDSEDSEVSSRSLSTLLNEMDGISGNDGVTILACTDDISQLDEALLRPGRLDYHFLLETTPNATDRLEIIRGYLNLNDDTYINDKDTTVIEDLVNSTEGCSSGQIKIKINSFKRRIGHE